MSAGSGEEVATRQAPGEYGIYRGRRPGLDRAAWRAGRSPAKAAFLAFLWPGLGHAYAGHRYRALLLAVPPLLLGVAGVIWIGQSPEAFALRLLGPTFAAAVLGAIGIHAGWRLVAILDAWRRTRSRPWREDGSTLVVLVLSAVILTVHGAVGFYIASVHEAGSKIFSGDAASEAGSGFDDLLGGDGPLDGDQDWSDGDPGPGTLTPGPPPGAPPAELPRSEPISILVIGTDAGPGRSHSLTDSLIVVTYVPDRDQVSMISFPRDTGRLPMYDGRVFGPRINTMLSRANRDSVRFPDGGIGTLVAELGYLVGVPIQYWVLTDMGGFKDLVDVVGGVDVRLDKQIADASTGLFLESGTYHMTGDEVMEVVRSRRGPGNSDWERARRQQQVLRGIASRMRDPSVAVRAPEVLSAASQLVRTNVPPDQLAELFRLLGDAEHATTHNVVLSPTQYATRIPPEEVNGRYMTQLKMDALRALSLDLFGDNSRYADPVQP